jgi:hypothetical protein
MKGHTGTSKLSQNTSSTDVEACSELCVVAAALPPSGKHNLQAAAQQLGLPPGRILFSYLAHKEERIRPG